MFVEDIPGARKGNVDLLKVTISRNSGSAHVYGVYIDVVGEKRFQYVAVTGLAADLASVADHEDYSAAGTVSLRKIDGGGEDRVIQNTRFAPRHADVRNTGIEGNAVDRGAASPGAAYHRSTAGST